LLSAIELKGSTVEGSPLINLNVSGGNETSGQLAACQKGVSVYVQEPGIDLTSLDCRVSEDR
jgi:hypothetical protein